MKLRFYLSFGTYYVHQAHHLRAVARKQTYRERDKLDSLDNIELNESIVYGNASSCTSAKKLPLLLLHVHVMHVTDEDLEFFFESNGV